MQRRPKGNTPTQTEIEDLESENELSLNNSPPVARVQSQQRPHVGDEQIRTLNANVGARPRRENAVPDPRRIHQFPSSSSSSASFRPAPMFHTPLQPAQNTEFGTQTSLDLAELDRTIRNLTDELRLANERYNDGRAQSSSMAAQQAQDIRLLQAELAAAQEQMSLSQSQTEAQLQQQRTEFTQQREEDLHNVSENMTKVMQQLFANVPQRLHEMRLADFVEQARKIQREEHGLQFAKLFASSNAPEEIAQNIMNELSPLIDHFEDAVTDLESKEDIEETIQLHLKRQTQLTSEINYLQTLVHKGEKTATQLQKIIDSLISRLYALHSTNNRLLAVRSSSEVTLRAVRHSMVMIDLQRNLLATQIKAVSGENSMLKAKLRDAANAIERLETQYVTQGDRLSDANIQNVNLTNQLTNANDNLMQVDDEAINLTQHLNDADAQNVTLSNQLADANDNLMQVDDEATNLGEHLNDANATNVNLTNELAAAYETIAQLAERAKQQEIDKQNVLRLLGDAWERDGAPDNDPHRQLENEPIADAPPTNRLTRWIENLITLMRYISYLFALWVSLWDLARHAWDNVHVRKSILQTLAREFNTLFGRWIRLLRRSTHYAMYFTSDQLKIVQALLPDRYQNAAGTFVDAYMLPLQYRDRALEVLGDLPVFLEEEGSPYMWGRVYSGISQNWNNLWNPHPPISHPSPSPSVQPSQPQSSRPFDYHIRNPRPQTISSPIIQRTDQDLPTTRIPTFGDRLLLFGRKRLFELLETTPEGVQTMHERIEWSARLPATISNHGVRMDMRRGTRTDLYLPSSAEMQRDFHAWDVPREMAKAAVGWGALALGSYMVSELLRAVLGFTIPRDTIASTVVQRIGGVASIAQIGWTGISVYVNNEATLAINPDAVGGIIHRIMPSATQVVGVPAAAWYHALFEVVNGLFGIRRQPSGELNSYIQARTLLVTAILFRIPIYTAIFQFIVSTLLTLTVGDQRARRLLNSPKFLASLFGFVVVVVFTDIVFNTLSQEDRVAILAMIPVMHGLQKTRDAFNRKKRDR